jgi:hypothetical protein
MDWVQIPLELLKFIPIIYKFTQEKFPLKHIDRVRFRTFLSPEKDANLKLKLYIDITNERSDPLVFSSAYFIPNKPTAIEFDPQIADAKILR